MLLKTLSTMLVVVLTLADVVWALPGLLERQMLRPRRVSEQGAVRHIRRPASSRASSPSQRMPSAKEIVQRILSDEAFRMRLGIKSRSQAKDLFNNNQWKRFSAAEKLRQLHDRFPALQSMLNPSSEVVQVNPRVEKPKPLSRTEWLRWSRQHLMSNLRQRWIGRSPDPGEVAEEIREQVRRLGILEGPSQWLLSLADASTPGREAFRVALERALTTVLSKWEAGAMLTVLDEYQNPQGRLSSYGITHDKLDLMVNPAVGRHAFTNGVAREEVLRPEGFQRQLERLKTDLEEITDQRLLTEDDFRRTSLHLLTVDLPAGQGSVTLDLLNPLTVRLLNNLLFQLDSQHRIYLSGEPDYPSFAYGEALDEAIVLASPAQDRSRRVRLLIFGRPQMQSPLTNLLAGQTAGDDVAAIFMGTLWNRLTVYAHEYLDRRSGTELERYHFFDLLEVHDIPTLKGHFADCIAVTREWASGQEVGHLSHFLASGIPIDDLEPFITPFLRPGAPSRLVDSLMELLADVAPVGVLARAQRLARQNPSHAAAMLKYHLVNLLGYEALWISPTQHYRYELPLLYALLQDRPEKLEERLRILLEEFQIFDKLNHVFTTIYREFDALPSEAAQRDYLATKEQEVTKIIVSAMTRLGAVHEWIEHVEEIPSDTEADETKLRCIHQGQYEVIHLHRPESHGIAGSYTNALIEGLSQVMKAGDDLLDLGAAHGEVALVFGRRAGKVVATDIDGSVLAWARQNFMKHGLSKIQTRQGDLFATIQPGEQFDVIAANPPAVPIDPDRIDEVTAFGEHLMLANDGGLAGRRFLDRIIDEAPAYLKPGGRLVLVHSDFTDLDKTIEGLRRQGLRVEIVKEVNVLLPRSDNNLFWLMRDWITREGYMFTEHHGRLYYTLYVISAQRIDPIDGDTDLSPLMDSLESSEGLLHAL